MKPHLFTLRKCKLRDIVRKEPLINNCLYHIFTKSIAGYKIFRSPEDYSRMVEMMKFYSWDKPPLRFSLYKTIKRREEPQEKTFGNKENIVQIIAYCLMPTHLHLILVQLKDKGISIYMKNLLDSYTRYFNVKNGRKGPLWQGRFKSVLIDGDEQLLHLTRYIHLNPTSDELVEKVEDWPYSSYHEFLGLKDETICNFSPYLDIKATSYRHFIEERKDYQARLAEINHLLLE